MLAADRSAFLDDQALRAHDAAEAGDLRISYVVARALGAARLASVGSIAKKDGTMTKSPQEIITRWSAITRSTKVTPSTTMTLTPSRLLRLSRNMRPT